MNEQEKSFFEWWDKVEAYQNVYNLRMAFDAGYQAALKDLEK
jgi:hypothetical protein